MRLPFAMFIAVGVLFGCASAPDVSPPSAGHTDDKPKSYTLGYGDGCSSGTHAAGLINVPFKKDADLYTADSAYRQGYEEGFTRCKVRAYIDGM